MPCDRRSVFAHAASLAPKTKRRLFRSGVSPSEGRRTRTEWIWPVVDSWPRQAVHMTDRARKPLQDATALSEDERLDLAEQLLSSRPADQEWLAELERRA